MAVYRPVQVSYWQDAFVLDLTPEEKYFYLYLMTNSKTSQSGIYELPLRVIEMDTGYNRETVEKLLERFAEYGKINYNKKIKEIMLLNWLKFNAITNMNIEKCVLKEIQSIKDEDFLLDFYETCLELEKQQEFKIPRIKEYFQARFEWLARGFETPAKEETKEETKTETKEEAESRPEEKKVAEDNPIAFYEQNFGVIKPFVAEGINAWVNDLNEQLVIKAMKIALEKNAPNMSYVQGILRDWHAKGYKSINDVEAAQAQFRKKYQSRSVITNARKEIVPDWLHTQDTEVQSQPIEHSEMDLEAERNRLEQVLAKYRKED
ncbi:TPA: DnaD domain protein [Bacillus wiedmannii]|uniref:DnaD domain-containing protein n=1 Tax=Bacillus wiedmannii TaxID=1890302 RepID=UPI000BF904A8|nr:DnaD domain protein [Bacillus wiedmannii]PEP54028.1 replication protein [Bacillus wiedmannii]HDX9652516.1 DnaD domain protein [Bacillus wiedmannii]